MTPEEVKQLKIGDKIKVVGNIDPSIFIQSQYLGDILTFRQSSLNNLTIYVNENTCGFLIEWLEKVKVFEIVSGTKFKVPTRGEFINAGWKDKGYTLSRPALYHDTYPGSEILHIELDHSGKILEVNEECSLSPGWFSIKGDNIVRFPVQACLEICGNPDQKDICNHVEGSTAINSMIICKICGEDIRSC